MSENVFIWRCGDCGSSCAARYYEYALTFGDKHRCSGPKPTAPAAAAVVGDERGRSGDAGGAEQ